MFYDKELEYEHKNNYTSGGTDYFGFSFGSAKEPVDNRVGLVNSTHTCREGLMSNMRTRILGKSSHSQPTDKTRMLFFWKASRSQNAADLKLIDGWVKRSVVVIQTFDRLAGWPITRVQKVNCGQDYIKAFYFRSSRRWMKSSYLISLYVLLVRMCKDERISDFKNFNGLIDIVGKYANADIKDRLKMDQTYVKSSYPYWEAIMKGYPRLFRKRKMEYYWDTQRLNGNEGGYEGIQYLVGGDTKYKEVRAELLTIKKELDAKTFKPTKKKEA